jgi:hypothetical protein
MFPKTNLYGYGLYVARQHRYDRSRDNLGYRVLPDPPSAVSAVFQVICQQQVEEVIRIKRSIAPQSGRNM